MAISLTVTKAFAEKCRSLCMLIAKCVHAKVMAAFLDTLINMMFFFNLHIFWWIYMVYVAGQFLGIVWKSSRRFLCSKCLNWHKWEIKNQVYARVMPVKKETRRINYKPITFQNAALQLNGMHLNIPSTECLMPCRAASSSGTAWVGNAYAKSLAPWPILSISGYDDTTSPHQTFECMIYDCNTHPRLWYLNFIAILSFVCPKLDALNYWLAYTMTDTYLLTVL